MIETKEERKIWSIAKKVVPLQPLFGKPDAFDQARRCD